MIQIDQHLRLRNILGGEKAFPVGVELVSTRGAMSQCETVRVREFGEMLTHSPAVDWVSITDNAGGNPQLAPIALGTPILYAGKEVVIHLTCKDFNRHGLESQLWLLASQGFHNVLAMTGDYPMESFHGRAKPVFDIDSVALLEMITRMNDGIEVAGRKPESASRRLDGTHFHAGAVTSSFKAQENTLLPQYYKLEKKIAGGAKFIINQIGFDARKSHELLAYMQWRGLGTIPLVGNVYLLSLPVAGLFHRRKIPGIVLTDALLEICKRQAASPDKGRGFFIEFAAKQVAIYRGLGYRAVYLGGVHSPVDLEKILQTERTFAPEDWREFARETGFSQPGEFFLFEPDDGTGLCRPGVANPEWTKSLHSRERSHNVTPLYTLSKAFHSLMFDAGRGLAPLGAKLCASARDPVQGPAWLRAVERVSKSLLYQCRDCGDCSLSETAFLCPESQCAKNQRNGPCGGTRDGLCEVHDYECIWARAYDRLKYEGRSPELLAHAPVVQNQGLRDTSAWANFWLDRDHTSKPNTPNNNNP
jgi:methylenetetrahydrofolate reductase (NADPH)